MMTEQIGIHFFLIKSLKDTFVKQFKCLDKETDDIYQFKMNQLKVYNIPCIR